MNPFHLDTHDLGRRAGSMREIERTIALPERLGNEVIGLPAGSELHLDLRLEAVMEGVLVSGTATGTAVGECVRCLREITLPVSATITELFAYEGRRQDVHENDEDYEPLPTLLGDVIDLEEAVTDALVIGLPFQPLCRPDCAGLCPDCGERLDDVEPGHAHEAPIDPRWAALTGLADDAEDERA